MRAERAWFLFRGERSPNGSEITRWGIERVMNPLPLPSQRFFGVMQEPRKMKENGVKNLKGAQAISSKSPGIADLKKKCPVRLSQIDIIETQIIIAVSEKKHSAGIEFIRKEKLGEKRLCLRVYFVFVESEISVNVLILKDGAKKSPAVEVVDKAHLRQLSQEKPFSVYFQPSV